MTTTSERTPLLARWQEYFHHPTQEGLLNLLAEDVVFVSPVVHTPQEGREKTTAYLWSAAQVFGAGPFEYLGEWKSAGGGADEGSAVLEFRAELEGIQIHGVDMIWWNAEQRITRFQVMVRPLKAMQLLHGKMARELAQHTSPSS